MTNEIKVCAKCVLDTHDVPDLKFDQEGICQYCRRFEAEYLNKPLSEQEKLRLLDEMKDTIRKAGKGKKYDCILGLSGGVDSSYMAYLAKDWGLRPLIVHFDNGWNSELAVKNIESIIAYTGFDLYTHVVNWDEFRSLQLAYIKSGVLDWEVPTDHGFMGALFRAAKKEGIKHILTGSNHQTEGILPKSMSSNKDDSINILDIARKFGAQPFKTYPFIGPLRHIYYTEIYGFERHAPLNWIDYHKDRAKETIIREMGWRDYGGKHYESVFTRFYQGYVLPVKYGIDKRKAHFASLINSGQMTREEAMEVLKTDPYGNEDLKWQDFEFVAKKLGMSQEELHAILAEKPVSHQHYRTIYHSPYRNIRRWVKLGLYYTSASTWKRKIRSLLKRS